MLNLSTNGELLNADFVDSSRDEFLCSPDPSYLTYLIFIFRQIDHGTDPITFQEETFFYLYWICKFLVCNSSKWITLGFAHIAVTLAKGKRLAFSPLILALLYRCIFLLLLEPIFLHQSMATCGFCNFESLLIFLLLLLPLLTILPCPLHAILRFSWGLDTVVTPFLLSLDVLVRFSSLKGLKKAIGFNPFHCHAYGSNEYHNWTYILYSSHQQAHWT